MSTIQILKTIQNMPEEYKCGRKTGDRKMKFILEVLPWAFHTAFYFCLSLSTSQDCQKVGGGVIFMK